MSTLRQRFLTARYNIFPDHVFGEILAKRWADNAIPFLTLLLLGLAFLYFTRVLPGYNLTEYGGNMLNSA